MKKDKPTPRQIDALQNMHIVPPPWKRDCTRLIGWVTGGGEEMGNRIATVIDAQKRYIGKRVQHVNGKTGTVRYITHLGPGRAEPAEEDHHYTHPLDAILDWDDGNVSQASIGSLTPID